MKPKIQIVDENDNIIGYKYRDQLDYSKDIYRISLLWLENSEGGVLIAQRKFTKDKDPGKWGAAVTGTVDEGETYDQNVYKEAEEEIGLTGIKFEFIKKIRITKPRNYFAAIYFAKVDKDASEFVIQEEEVEQVKWVPKAELAEDIKNHPENYTLPMVEYINLFLNMER